MICKLLCLLITEVQTFCKDIKQHNFTACVILVILHSSPLFRDQNFCLHDFKAIRNQKNIYLYQN